MANENTDNLSKIDFGYKEYESYFRLGGKPVVAVDVAKRSGTKCRIFRR